ncbi:MAG: trypsin-like peptidase domain-containing protein [Chloroflexi bacterium]|nr:trypsin-like peptidase domain-containing protein [Chloroflexota bacterium]
MSEILRNLSDAMAEAVQAAGSSIVRVEARRRMPASGIVWSADGLIITAHHVVENDENIRVSLPDGSRARAALVGRDPNSDVAVLRAETGGLTVPTWADADAVRVGHLALAVGRPGDQLQTTLGVISALSHSPNDHQYFAQTDVVMYPGFSGGPLVSVTGAIIGLNTSGLMRGISLAVQTPTLRYVADSLLQHGRMRRGYLGVGVQPVKLPGALAEQLGQKTGVLVMSVEPDSPAERGGLFLGDTIVAVDGERVETGEDLVSSLGGGRIGQTVAVRIIRGGQTQDVQVAVGERS